MRVLVTGHKGFIGAYLYSALQRAGHEVLGVDKKNDDNILSCRLPDADIVFHLAAQTQVMNSVENPTQDAKDNILTTIKIAERYKNSRIIYASSAGTIQEVPSSPYGLSKKTGEEYLGILHSDTVICRFSNVVGKGSAGIIEIFKSNNSNLIYGDGRQTRDYVHVNDIVRGLLLAMDWNAGLYEMESEVTISVLEIARIIGKPYKFAPARAGELLVSECRNTTPNWTPEINIIEYIRS